MKSKFLQAALLVSGWIAVPAFGQTSSSKETSKITLSSEKETDENSFDQPLRISPRKEMYSGFSASFGMEFKPYSLTVLRIKKGQSK